VARQPGHIRPIALALVNTALRCPFDQLSLTAALRGGHPSPIELASAPQRGPLEAEAGALPLVGPAGYHGDIVVFCVLADAGDGARDPEDLAPLAPDALKRHGFSMTKARTIIARLAVPDGLVAEP
jgi:hypothetical protein